MTRSAISVFTLVATLALAACGDDAPDPIAGPGALGHIHDLVLTEGDLLVASHSGLYRIDGLDQAVLVGTEQHDLMAMSIDAQGLIASGHPDLRLEKYHVDDHPPHLGLARSSDFGETWTIEDDLLGKHDFHAIVPTADGIFAADSEGLILRRDPDGVWVELGAVEARDLAVHPLSTDEQVATASDGAAWVSDDGALTWQVVPGAPPLLEIEWPAMDLLLGASEDGTIWRATDVAGPWVETANAPPDVETFHVQDGQWWVTVHGGAIHTSTDQGQTWIPVYQPPQR